MPNSALQLPRFDTVLLAFGFGNAMMLAWLAAAALPIIIHLWNKRKYREVPWAAMEYLLAAMRKNSRRIRVEQWLLLAVRTLIVVLIVLAVAEPFMERLGLSFVAGTRTLKIFVIDGSYSMAFKPADRSRFDQAKALAQQIVEDSPQGDGFTLVLMAAPPVTIVGKPALEKQEFFDELQNLKFVDGGGDLSATLAKVEEIFQEAKSSGLDRTEVYFLTDLGRTSWSPDQLSADFQQRVEKLGQQASLVVLDLGQGSAENLAVTAVSLSEPYATIDHELTILTQVRNFGTQPKLRHLVELLVDGRRVNDTLIDVKPGETATATFHHRFESAGGHLFEIRLGPDSLDVDNHRWLALSVKQQLRVLCVDGKPAGDGISGAADYVMLALNPNLGDTTSRWPIVPEIASESSIVERDLSQYDAIFLCNVGQFTGSEARVLSTYVKQGGGLILFLGDRVQPDRYNRELGAGGVKLLPAELGGIVSEAQYRFDPLDYRHHLTAPFKGREQAGLLTTPVYKYFQLKPLEKSSAKVAMAFAQGDPAIIEQPVGRGRVILMATDGSLSSIDPVSRAPWTSMSAWPSFLPLVQEMFALAAGSQLAGHNLIVGDALSDVMRTRAAKESLTIQTPADRNEPLRLTTDEEGSRWTFADTFQSGPYRIESGTPSTSADSAKQQSIYAVNVDTRESNLARIDATEMLPQFTTTVPSTADDSSSANVARFSGLHRLLLYSVMGLLFLEVFLAWRAGHTTA
jgi:hypothetical protein